MTCPSSNQPTPCVRSSKVQITSLFGHTHRPGVWRRSQRLLINTGAFVTFAKPLLVEIKNQQLSVHPLAERRDHWQKQSPIASEFLSPKPNS